VKLFESAVERAAKAPARAATKGSSKRPKEGGGFTKKEWAKASTSGGSKSTKTDFDS
jgi:hypothetical protein